MIYTDFHGEKLSLLGFGTMRLPLVPGGGPADIDEKTTADMVRYAMDHGVNYFDTAWPYHGGLGEPVLGRILSRCPRETYSWPPSCPAGRSPAGRRRRSASPGSWSAFRRTMWTSTFSTA